MSTSAGECKIDRIKLSQKMINFIFDDINATYKQSGGGGISEIKEMQTNIYIVSIPQEERIDRIKYHLSVDEKCEISIVKKEQSTINFGQ